MTPPIKPSIAIALAVLLAACKPPAPAPQPDAAAPPPTPATAAAPAPPENIEAPQSAQVLAPPSFDCAKASDESEKMVCSDAELSALDRQLDAEFSKSLARPDADVKTVKAMQVGWIKGRNDCWKADDKRVCVREAYLTQIVQLKLDSGEVMVPTPVEYVCDDHSKPFTAVFYNDMDPKAVVLTWGNDQAIAFPKLSASGSRYGRDGLDFWEHQGEVKVDFYGNKLTCKVPG